MSEEKKSRHAVIGMIDEAAPGEVIYCHERHPVGACPWCDFIRVENISKEFERRLDVCNQRIQSLNMWSLGTSLKDTAYNRQVLLGWWRVFSRRLDRDTEWLPLFRVVEVGRRGYLHIHCICGAFVAHEKVLRIWRSITGEASNVNVSGSGRNREPRTLIRYLVKYLSKQGSAYRWLGPLYGLGDTSRRIRSGGRRTIRYGGETCYSLNTRAYPENDGGQRKIDKD